MIEWVSWGITVLIGVLLLGAIFYVVGLRSLPLAERPRTPTYDRFGRLIATAENPDYHVNPGEDPHANPGV